MIHRSFVILLLACSGCAIGKFNAPPVWASSITTHVRFFGLNASIPVGGGEVLGVKLGWGSSTWTVVPVSTNKVYSPNIADTFSLGQGLNPFDTVIKEDLLMGYQEPNGAAPTPRFQRLFDPKLKTDQDIKKP